jgi:Uncharacterized protein conserved in bacteria
MSKSYDREQDEARERARRSLADISDAEDAALTAAAESDGDNPVLSADAFAAMRRADEVVPDVVEASERRRRGQRGPQKAPTREAVTLRLSPRVLRHFRSGGPGWQTRINAALEKLVDEP